MNTKPGEVDSPIPVESCFFGLSVIRSKDLKVILEKYRLLLILRIPRSSKVSRWGYLGVFFPIVETDAPL